MSLPNATVGMTSIANCDVLLVDNDKIVTALAERRLRDSVFTIKSCSSGEEALEYLSDANARLLLVDLNMKPMDGIEFLEALAADNRLESMQAYLSTSAVPEDSVQSRLQEMGIEIVSKSDILSADGIAQLLK